ncbi:hypothetical protein KDK_29450 [Dictyobacter kobayashii]|uniref:Uncharacterized protein n=1 Tax=Dictyobacter kobayashii TaxID=2014872 RepID=A0A402AJB8_9CHLR|nr:hypothetical protein KDK_29450 [Dictyobacter kobayashii]
MSEFQRMLAPHSRVPLLRKLVPLRVPLLPVPKHQGLRCSEVRHIRHRMLIHLDFHGLKSIVPT